MAQRLPALLTLAVGVALLVGPFVLFPHAGQPHCINSVEPIAGDEIPSDAEVRGYADLSADAKRVFDRARAAPDGRVAVYGERCPAEFVYADYVREYVIEAGGEHYVLETAGGGTFAGDLFAAIGFGLVGLALVGLGGHAATRDDRTEVQSLVSGGLAGLGVIALLAAAADASIVLVLALTAFGIIAAYLDLGYALPPRWALGLGALASAGVWAVLARSGVHGSAVAVALVPMALTGLGLGAERLRRALFP